MTDDEREDKKKTTPMSQRRRKPDGAKPMSKRKLPEDLKETFVELVRKYSEYGLLDQDFEALTPKDRIDAVIKLVQYLTPKDTNINLYGHSNITIEQKLINLINNPDF